MKLKILLWFIGWFVAFLLFTGVIDMAYYRLYYKHLPKEKQEQIDNQLREWDERTGEKTRN